MSSRIAKTLAACALALLPLISVSAAPKDTLCVSSFRHAGPFTVQSPATIDSVNVDGKAFKIEDAAFVPVSPSAVGILSKSCSSVEGLPVEAGLHMAGFSLETRGFTKAEILLEGLKDSKLYLDGSPLQGKSLKLEPGTHELALRYYIAADDTLSKAPAVKVVGGQGLSLRTDGLRILSLDVNTRGVSCAGAGISPLGTYYTIGSVVIGKDGKRSYDYALYRSSDDALLSRSSVPYSWVPKVPAAKKQGKKASKSVSQEDEYYYTVPGLDGRSIVAVNPATMSQRTLASGIPDGYYRIVPGGRKLIYVLEQKGPKEGAVHEILTPDDRQEGWRNRSRLALYDIESRVMEPLTWGWHDVTLQDVSADGSKILYSHPEERLTARPTTLYSLFVMDLESRQSSCLISKDGFFGSASFSPDGSEALIEGTPEALGGIGKDVPEGVIPNIYDRQLFVVNVASAEARPITKDFDPSVIRAQWAADGFVYLIADEKDCKNLFRIDPKTSKWERLPNKEEHLSFLKVAADGKMVYYGQSLCNGDRVYMLDTRSLSQKCLRDISASRLEGVDIGEGLAFEFTSSRGDLINGFYVLPPGFDPSKKYPLLVHYYGGCNPSSRYCIGSYSPQLYAAQGYVFYVVNPSGASGFGQEFSSRHVNTAGEGVAEDILEGVEKFCEAHPFVDREHIGCFSASYGGFMTQLLLSKSDMFAAGISHAGISDHTSYWGEGYWGYSYSQVCMAESYPWTRKDLYVDRSPLYNADKIHTPLLFLHGSADTNVPIGESIQMFTALKLLGQDTAFVVVDGENHGIRDYDKRRQWLRTISAWFAKYLKEDPSWWEELYPEKNL